MIVDVFFQSKPETGHTRKMESPSLYIFTTTAAGWCKQWHETLPIYQTFPSVSASLLRANSNKNQARTEATEVMETAKRYREEWDRAKAYVATSAAASATASASLEAEKGRADRAEVWVTLCFRRCCHTFVQS